MRRAEGIFHVRFSASGAPLVAFFSFYASFFKFHLCFIPPCPISSISNSRYLVSACILRRSHITQGNKSFVAFSNLNDSEALTKTWKVCTKVAGYLEQGQRLENISWRLWHLQNLMVDTDNAKSKRDFKKLSKCMCDKLDKEKGR